MFNIFKRITEIENYSDETAEAASYTSYKLKALEDYLGIEFFHGDKMRPHYRKKKVIKKKVGRPKGSKNIRREDPVTVHYQDVYSDTKQASDDMRHESMMSND